jgi:hypothetical protein
MEQIEVDVPCRGHGLEHLEIERIRRSEPIYRQSRRQTQARGAASQRFQSFGEKLR